MLIRHRPADEGFDHSANVERLEARDRAFALNLVATTLRRLGQIDAIIGRFLDRPLPARAADARNLLRLAVCQLAFLQTPAHAAVHTAVALAASRKALRPYGGLVNAVLRRAATEAAGIVAAQDAPRLNTPHWLWASWEAAYGKAMARAIAEAHLAEPPLDLTLKKPDAVPADLGGVHLHTGSLRLRHKGPVAALSGYATGGWWVQDAAAALPATLFGDVAGRRVIDLCAAPGGKTAQLAAARADIVAVERSAARLRQLAGNLERLKLKAELISADATEWRPEKPADAVLLDAPCSATGTIRRHPDVARIKKPADVAALAASQARLLAAATEMTRPGGTLVYCACSLQPEEGPAQVESLLASRADLARVPIEAGEIGGLAEAVTHAGDVRTLPCHFAELGGMDGFYIARLRRL